MTMDCGNLICALQVAISKGCNVPYDMVTKTNPPSKRISEKKKTFKNYDLSFVSLIETPTNILMLALKASCICIDYSLH